MSSHVEELMAKDKAFNALMAQHGFCIRTPSTKFQWHMALHWRDYRWVRRLLGGKWEVYCHDQGTTHYMLSYHWVEKFHYDIKGMIGREEYN